MLVFLFAISFAVQIGCGRYVHPQDRAVYDAFKRLGAEMDLNPRGRIASVELSRTPATDDDLRHLVGLDYVWCVSLYDTAVTDRGLTHLAGLGNLKWVDVENTQVTKAGLLQLARLRKVITVWVGGTPITDSDVAELKARMPQTSFRRSLENPDPFFPPPGTDGQARASRSLP